MNQNSSSITPVEFAELFIRYKQAFYSIALSYLKDSMVAEDIVSDSFMAFWERREQLPPNTNIPAYILATTKNKCLNWLKEQSLHNQIEQKIHSTRERVIQANIRSLEACDPIHLFSDEVAAIVARKLAELPELTREVFVASRYNGKSYKEISDELNIPLRRVDYELQRALKALQAALKDYLPATLIAVLLQTFN